MDIRTSEEFDYARARIGLMLEDLEPPSAPPILHFNSQRSLDEEEPEFWEAVNEGRAEIDEELEQLRDDERLVAMAAMSEPERTDAIEQLARAMHDGEYSNFRSNSRFVTNGSDDDVPAAPRVITAPSHRQQTATIRRTFPRQPAVNEFGIPDPPRVITAGTEQDDPYNGPGRPGSQGLAAESYPQPAMGEGQQEFIDRCLADPTLTEQFPNPRVRGAICMGFWSAPRV